MVIKLRDYQIEAVNSVLEYWSGSGGNPLVEMATGTGKSLVIAKLNEHILSNFPGMRVLMLVHVRELVSQNAQAMLRLWPQAPLGIYSAGLNRRDTKSQILFASIQSVFRRGHEIGTRDIVMIDEAHLVPREGEGMYRTLLESLREKAPDLRVAGFTATPYRLDTGRLDDGDDRLFHDTVYSYDIARGVADKYLSPLRARSTTNQIDTSGVHRKGGEFVAGELEAAANDDDVVEGACGEITRLGADRRSWLVFCAGVKHATNVMQRLRARGVTCEIVTGDTPSGTRDRIFAAFKSGKIRALAGVQVFTTGFDAPCVDMIAMLRPTLSAGLYVQMLGRGTRLYDGKKDCLVLDFAGNVMRHGPVDAVKVKPHKVTGGEGEAPTKICPQCEFFCHAAALKCEDCGYVWPVKDEPKHDRRADRDAPVMTQEIVAQWLPVTDVRVGIHQKEGKPDSLVVEYCCGFQNYREWVCFEHHGFARKRACAWWRAMGGKMQPPKTVAEAMVRAVELEIVKQITVVPDGKYWRINGYRIDSVLDGPVPSIGRFEIDKWFGVKMLELA